jgi:hypothetical protein
MYSCNVVATAVLHVIVDWLTRARVHVHFFLFFLGGEIQLHVNGGGNLVLREAGDGGLRRHWIFGEIGAL